MSDVNAIFAQIDAMSPAEKLRLAAGLLDESQAQRRPQLISVAYKIADRAVTELGAAQLFAERSKP